jgi:3-hydroxyisobutyrate dehydrogenase-like beta-hydroxyacid dehydrogenase
MAERPALGFIGLGLMGQACTRRLVAQGYAVAGHDRIADQVAAAAAHGVTPAADAAAVAAAAELIHICVMTAADLEDAVFGPRGVAAGGGPGKMVIDHSTTPVAATRAFAARLEAEAGMAWIDAPVSGGPPAAAAGTLALMAGGSDAALARALPVLDALGTCTVMGGVGAGQVTKMVNQILVLTNYCVLAEALALAEAGGIDAARIPQALASGYAGSNMLARLYPRMLARDFAPAGYAFQALKDLDMVQDLARQLGTPTPMAGQAAALFRLLTSKGHGGLDGIAVMKLYDPRERV